MALPSSGTITMDMVRVELKRPTGAISLNDTDVRKLAGRLSGPISMSDLWGKSAGPSLNFVPSSFSPFSGSDLQVYFLAGGTYEAYDNNADEQLFGTWISPAMEVGVSYPMSIKNTSGDTLSFTVYLNNISSSGSSILNNGQSVSFTATPAGLNRYIHIVPNGNVTGQTVSIEMTLNGTTSTFEIHA